MIDATTEFDGSKILWIDDNIQKFTPWIQRFGEHGVAVDSFDDINSADKYIKDNNYQAIIIDQMMPSGKGTDSLYSIKKNSPGSHIYICSAYFYLDDVLNDIGELNKKVTSAVRCIDKSSLPETDDHENIRKFLKDILFGGEEERFSNLVNSNFELNIDRKDQVYWLDYMNLDINEKINLHERVANWTRDSREEEFNDGYSYLVYCGDWDRPFAKKTDRPFSGQELSELARSTGFAPFTFSSGGSIDDLTLKCSQRKKMRGYPVIGIRKGDNTEFVHFDTGNPLTLLSYEYYTMNGWMNPAFRFDMHYAGELTLTGLHIVIPDIIFVDYKEATQYGELKAFAVLKWDNLRLSSKCDTDCEISKKIRKLSGTYDCVYRTGLIGRSIGDDINVDFQVNVHSGAVHFRERT